MSVQKRYGFCKKCNKRVEIYRKGASHVMHFILSICTLGLWLIVWLLSLGRFGGWRCCECGSTKVKPVN